MKTYVLYSKDKYRLPVAIADSMMELAKSSGLTLGSIKSMVSKTKHGHDMRACEVIINDED